MQLASGAGKSPNQAHQTRMCNSCEAAIVATVVSAALSAGCPANDIGVMSPYRAQLRLLRSLMENLKGVEVRYHNRLVVVVL